MGHVNLNSTHMQKAKPNPPRATKYTRVLNIDFHFRSTSFFLTHLYECKQPKFPSIRWGQQTPEKTAARIMAINPPFRLTPVPTVLGGRQTMFAAIQLVPWCISSDDHPLFVVKVVITGTVGADRTGGGLRGGRRAPSLKMAF